MHAQFNNMIELRNQPSRLQTDYLATRHFDECTYSTAPRLSPRRTVQQVSIQQRTARTAHRSAPQRIAAQHSTTKRMARSKAHIAWRTAHRAQSAERKADSAQRTMHNAQRKERRDEGSEGSIAQQIATERTAEQLGKRAQRDDMGMIMFARQDKATQETTKSKESKRHLEIEIERERER